MNQHLKSATERYKGKEFLINPISPLDAEIIWELIIALGKTKGAEELKEILDNWKLSKDEITRDELLQWNINNDESKVDEIFKRPFIELNGKLIDVQLMRQVDSFDSYNFDTKKPVYKIVINKGYSDKYLLSDLPFVFDSFEEREEKLEALKKELNKYITVIGI